MQVYIVEGYKKTDYISEIYNWEFLGEFFKLVKALEIQENFQKEGYVCRIKFDKKKNFDPTASVSPEENVHWEIFCGI